MIGENNSKKDSLLSLDDIQRALHQALRIPRQYLDGSTNFSAARVAAELYGAVKIKTQSQIESFLSSLERDEMSRLISTDKVRTQRGYKSLCPEKNTLQHGDYLVIAYGLPEGTQWRVLLIQVYTETRDRFISDMLDLMMEGLWRE